MSGEPETLEEITGRLKRGTPKEIVGLRQSISLHLDTIERHCRAMRREIDEWVDEDQKLMLAIELDDDEGKSK